MEDLSDVNPASIEKRTRALVDDFTSRAIAGGCACAWGTIDAPKVVSGLG